MTMDVNLIRSFAATVDWLHAGLIQTATKNSFLDRERGLGGKLFYAGDIDGMGSALVVAANIAGAATLTASADPFAPKQAIRDGVIDFLVTSLDEALRILKNEIRKCLPVAVCVGLSPEQVEREMLERGVLPDLLPPGTVDSFQYEAVLEVGARQIEPAAAARGQSVLMWSVAEAPARWLPRLDAVADECLGQSPNLENRSAHRWLRMAPRYLGRLALGVRLLRCQELSARRFLDRVSEQVATGEIAVPVEIHLSGHGDSIRHCFTPPQAHRKSGGLTPIDRPRSQSASTIP
jgi:urocanate hydratase